MNKEAKASISDMDIAERRLPARLFRILRSFPQDEVLRLFFFVLVGIDARADL